jgi:regulatory protein
MRRPTKPPKRITADRLARISTHYLDRFTTSSSNLRRLLARRADLAAAHHGEDPADGRALVDAEITRLEGLGWLDDAAYARGKARALVRRGNGARSVIAKLRSKGISPDATEAALLEVREELGVDPQLVAVVKAAKRRRFGPWAREPVDAAGRWKAIQALGRAGFSYELAARVVDAKTPEELEEEAEP